MTKINIFKAIVQHPLPNFISAELRFLSPKAAFLILTLTRKVRKS